MSQRTGESGICTCHDVSKMGKSPNSGDTGSDGKRTIHPVDAFPRLDINDLPVEILSEIFALCLPDEEYPEIRAGLAPMVLCRVCSLWRTLVSSMSDLWCSFSVPVVRIDLEAPRKILSHFLDKAGNRPLCFKLGPSSSQLLPLLRLQIHRWEDVRFETLDGEVVRELLKISPQSASLLEHLCIWDEGRYTYTSEQLDQLVECFSTLPNLRTLEWTDYVAVTPSLVDSQWPNLTWFELDYPLVLETFLRLLSHCPRLEHVRFLHDPDTPGPILPILEHPHLVSLYIVSEGNYGDLLGHLTLPSLRTLKIHADVPSVTEMWDYQKIQRFVARSACSLTKLHWIGSHIEEEALIDLMSMPSFRTVQYLNISSTYTTDRTLDMLTIPNPKYQDQDAFPLLRYLMLGYLNVADGRFSDMLVSRWEAAKARSEPPSLECAGAWRSNHYAPGNYPIDETCFKRLAQEGLHIEY